MEIKIKIKSCVTVKMSTFCVDRMCLNLLSRQCSQLTAMSKIYDVQKLGRMGEGRF